MSRPEGPEILPTAMAHDPFSGPELERVSATTEAQREIFAAASWETAASCAYNEGCRLRLHGVLNREALTAAITAVLARHEALRASFTPDGTRMCIAAPAPVRLALTQLAAGADHAAQLSQIYQNEVETPFDLVNGPLSRWQLVALASDEHELIVGAHHLVCDGWSTGTIVEELCALYNATVAGSPPTLAAAMPYSVYTAAVPAAGAADLPYWQARFSQTPPVLDLPLDRPRPPLKTYASRRIDVAMPAALPARLRTLGSKTKSSLLAVLTTGLYGLLHRLSQQTDFVIGIPAAGQAPLAGKTLVGHCVHLLPILHTVDPAASFTSNLQIVRTQLFDAFDHQGLTYGTLLRHLHLTRDPGRSPLVSVMLNLDQTLPTTALAFTGLAVEFHSLPRHFENFELFLNLVASPGRITIEAQYNTDLFDEATVRDWLDSYTVLLDGAATAPETAVGKLPILAPSSRNLLLQTWNATQAPAPQLASLPAMLAAAAAATPQALAVDSSTGKLSFHELRRGAEQLAQHLAQAGVRPGDLVGIALERGPELLTGLLGILTAGAAYVPIDPSYPRERIALMLSDTKMPALVTSSALAAHLPTHAAKVIQLDREASILRAYPEIWATPPPRAPDAAAYVIFTSGSTGKPKGVVVPERAMVNFLASMGREPGLTANDKLLAVTTVSFDIHVLELFLPLSCGAAVYIASLDEASDPAALSQILAKPEITVMQATPATWQLLLSSGWPGAPRLKVLIGGEALPRELLRRLLPVVGSVWNMYGPTETTVWSTCKQLKDPDAPILIGKPIANTQVYIVDEHTQLVPVGVSGELLIGGDGVSLGYLERQDLTAARFIPDPFSARPGARLYRTGDLARWRRSGEIECLGRNDQQVKLRGYRIELGEIEAALAAHPAVAQVVCGVRDKAPGDPRLIAWYTAKAGQRVEGAALRTMLQTKLPAYMVPQAFQALNELPLTPNGKVDRARLKAPFATTELASSPTLAAPPVKLVPSAKAATSPRGAAGSERRLPLTPPQARVLELQSKAPNSSLFNLPTGFRLRGKLASDALRLALQGFVARHESLRTTFSRTDQGVYEQVLAPAPNFVLAEIDLSASTPVEQESRLQADFRRIAEEPFDLGRGPLLKALLYHLSPNDNVLFIQAYHAIWDGWSFDLFVKETGHLYSDARASRPPSLPPLSVSYADYWLGQGEAQSAAAAASQIDYWREQLAAWAGPVRVPAARARPSLPSQRGASVSYSMPRDLANSLALLGKEHGATLFMVLLAAFQVLLFRLSGQNDVAVATPVRGRSDADSEALIGCFVGQVLLRARLAGAASFSSTLSELRVVITQGLAQDQIPLPTLARELGLGDLAALETIAFSFQDARGRATSFGDLPYQQINVEPKACGGELSFWVKEGRDHLLGSMNYATDIFSEAEIRSLLTAYNALLFALVEAPHRELADLPITLEDPRLRDVRGWYDAIPAAETRAQAHPAVRDCVISVRPAGEEPARLVVHYVVRPHDYLTTTDLRNFLRDALPVGCEPLVIELDATTEGEALDRQKLTLGLAQQTATQSGFLPPATEVERLIAAIWADLLGSPVVQISAQANFFELGGHSLLAIQMIAKIEQATGVKLGRMAVTLSTLGQIAAAIDTSHEIKITPQRSPLAAAMEADAISAADARPPEQETADKSGNLVGRLWQRLRGGK